MRFFITAAALVGIVLSAHAQVQPEDHDKYFVKLEVPAQYPGGDSAWNVYLFKHLRYPAEVLNDGVGGTVWVQFIVMRDSTIKDVQAFAGPDDDLLRNEAIKVVRESGMWVPGRQNGHQVNSYRKVPIKFVLQKS